MTTWKDGGDYGRFSREIVSEDGGHAICFVWVKRNAEHRSGGIDSSDTEPWPEGEANFRLILQAPRMLAALEAIRDQAECFLQPLPIGCATQVRWAKVRDRAVKAIAATREESNETELV